MFVRHALIGFLSVSSAWACGPEGTPPAPIAGKQLSTNAALLYHRAWLLESKETMSLVKRELSPPDQCVLDEHWEPSEDLVNALQAEQSQIARLLDAASVEECYFGLDSAQGPDRMLPHLGRLRDSAKLVRADAIRLMTSGDLDAAADRVAAMYGIAQHTLNDDVVIGSLIAAGIGQNADMTTIRLSHAGLSDRSRTILLKSIERMNPVDPAGCKSGLLAETKALLEWVRRFNGESAGADLCRSSLTQSMTPAEQKEFLSVQGMNATEVIATVLEYSKAVDELLKFIDLPDASTHWKEFKAQVETGTYGPLTRSQRGTLSALVATHWESVASRAAALKAIGQAVAK